MNNNIFTYATSELSQDAVICWLLSWSKTQCEAKDPHLYAVGKALLDSLLRKWGKTIPIVQKIEIYKQLYGIDIVADINDSITVVIEDKTGTHTHSNQLERYKALIEDNRKDCEIIYIYFKTHDFLPEENLQNSVFKIFDRSDMLCVLRGLSPSNNYLLTSFHDHLLALEKDSLSYTSAAISDWTWHACQGFYTALKTHFPDLQGKYIANPRGGFLGCWWNFNDFMNAYTYLQIETTIAKPVTTSLCFKIREIKAENPASVREAWLERLIAAALQKNVQLEITPRRLGMSMTVAKWPEDCRLTDTEGRIDMEETLNRLNQAAEILHTALK